MTTPTVHLRSAVIALGVAAILAASWGPAPAASQASPVFECRVGAGEQNEAILYGQLAGDDPAAQRAAADCLMAHPDLLEPVALAFLSLSLWTRGDRLQAAFWFYVFQARTRPGAAINQTYRQGRGALSAMIGGQVNGWLGSDQAAFHEVAQRAMAYEKRAPLYAGRHEMISAEAWAAQVETQRQADEAEYRAVMMRDDMKPAAVDAARRAAGMPVDPLDKPGAPLLEAWR